VFRIEQVREVRGRGEIRKGKFHLGVENFAFAQSFDCACAKF